jgi:hypothetical protein
LRLRSFWHNRRVNDEEATRILDGVVAELRREPYEILAARYLHESDQRTVVAESGVLYQVEVQAFWDSPRQPGNLRVIVAIDDGVHFVLSPQTSSSPLTAHLWVNELVGLAVA